MSDTKGGAARKPAPKADSTPSAPTDKITGNVVDSGPQTGVTAPAEGGDRSPSTVLTASRSGPLTPPSDTKTQTVPQAGYPESSTDHVHAEAGGRSLAGEDHLGLVDDDGKKVSAGSLFDDGDPAKTTVTAKTSVWEEFLFPHTTTVARRRLILAGASVPRAQAERIKAAVKDAPDAANKPAK